MKIFEIKVVLGILLVISYVANGNIFRHYDRRVLKEANGSIRRRHYDRRILQDAPIVPGMPTVGPTVTVPGGAGTPPVVPDTPTVVPGTPTFLPVPVPGLPGMPSILPGVPAGMLPIPGVPDPVPGTPPVPGVPGSPHVVPDPGARMPPIVPDPGTPGGGTTVLHTQLHPPVPGTPPVVPDPGADMPPIVPVPGMPDGGTTVLHTQLHPPDAGAQLHPPDAGATLFDVSKSAGAKDGGQADITAQLIKAWTDSCHSKAPAKILIPPGVWSVGQLRLVGPCTTPAPITVEVQGTLKANPDIASFPSGTWITFFKASVNMMGGGILDGQGELVWKSKKPGDKALPDSLSFSMCPNSSIENINIVNSKGFNMKVVRCDGFKANLLNISCAGDSPNTDGIHLGINKGVSITNSVIGVGDDCISIGDDSVDITVTNITCGPGHGISIGSLGRNPGEKDVRNVAVSNCTLRNTTNGARIKTFHDSPVLQASNISFTDITVENVTNPIIIDQNYFAKRPGDSKVKITGVTYKNFKGTSWSNKAITLNCSTSVPCDGISFADIDFTYSGNGRTSKDLMSDCANVKPTFAGRMSLPSC